MRVNLRGKVSHRRGRPWPSQKRSLLRQGRDAPRGARYPGPRRMVRRGPRYYAHGETCALVWRGRRAHRHGPVLRGYRTPSVFRIRYPVSLSGPGPSSRESAGRSAGAAPVPVRRPSHPDLPHPAARGERTRAPPRVHGAGPARRRARDACPARSSAPLAAGTGRAYTYRTDVPLSMAWCRWWASARRRRGGEGDLPQGDASVRRGRGAARHDRGGARRHDRRGRPAHPEGGSRTRHPEPRLPETRCRLGGRGTRGHARRERRGAGAPTATGRSRAEAGAVRPLPGEQTYTALAPPTVVPLAAERLRAEKRPTDLGAVRKSRQRLGVPMPVTSMADERRVPARFSWSVTPVGRPQKRPRRVSRCVGEVWCSLG